MENITLFFKRHILTIVGIGVGALGGYLYWYFIGCTTGNCPITASPTMTMIWGAALGGLVLSMFKKKGE